MIKNSLKDFFAFLKRPTDSRSLLQSISHKGKIIFSLLIVDLIAMMLLLALINSFNKFGWIKTENHQLTMMLDLFPVGMVLFLTIIFIPFIEEIIFRLFLRFERNYLLKAVIAIVPQQDKTRNKILYFWNKKYGYIFYFSAVAFALMHITNYDSKSTALILIPILVLPQFILALIIGYLRVRYNFMLGYLMHALHNAIFITLAFLTLNSSTVKLDLDTDIYSLKIEELGSAKNGVVTYGENVIQFDGVSFKSVIAALMQTEESLIISNNAEMLNKKINLNYRNNTTDRLNNDSIILSELSSLYSFKREARQEVKQVYQLYVIDTLKLLTHSSSGEKGASNTVVSKKEMTFKNVPLNQVAQELSANYNMRFESESDLSQGLNLTLPNENFEELEKILKTEYGIELKSSEKNIAHIYLSF